MFANLLKSNPMEQNIDINQKLTLSKSFVILTVVLMVIGAAALVYGFMANPLKTWANLLLNNYYFLSLVVGATFFAALQYVTQSGWSAGFIRVPQAISNMFPVLAITLLPVILFGMHDLYHWTHEDVIEHDPVVAHKVSYLNIPFFVFRYVLFFALWTLLTQLLKKFSLKEDRVNGMEYFRKSEFYSKVYIFILAVTFSLASFDWIMSIDVHWFSTIFAVRNFVMGFYHGVVVITIIVILLNKSGYLQFLTKKHIGDFSKYIFILSIIWTYTWFSQYILIWYANIPEETVYYLPRTKGEFRPLFYAELVINWLVPFIFLMWGRIAKNANAVLLIAFILVIGHWIDLYNQVIVGTYGKLEIGFIEAGTFLGFIGLFALITGKSLEAAPLVAENHPYMEETLQHEH